MSVSCLGSLAQQPASALVVAMAARSPGAIISDWLGQSAFMRSANDSGPLEDEAEDYEQQ